MANEADILRGKTSGQPDSARGVSAIPIRKKGYHRALKRGESWAKGRALLSLAQTEWAQCILESLKSTLIIPDRLMLAKPITDNYKIGDTLNIRKPIKFGSEDGCRHRTR